MKGVPVSISSPGWDDYRPVALIDPVSRTVTLIQKGGVPKVYPMDEVALHPEAERWTVPIVATLWGRGRVGRPARAVAFVYEGSSHMPNVVFADGSSDYIGTLYEDPELTKPVVR